MIGAVLFLSAFLLYLHTLPGSIPVYRDSGDMINAVMTLGIAHPPGYPMYVLTGKLFTLLMPFANLAYRVTAFSAFSAALSAALAYQVSMWILPDSAEQRGARAKTACAIAAAWYAL